MTPTRPKETVDADQVYFDERGKIQIKRAKAKPQKVEPLTAATEGQVWDEVKARLEQHGFYEPKKENQPPKKFMHGFYLSTQQKRPTGITEGIPDVLISLAGTHVWFPLELKPRVLLKSGKLKKPKCTDEQEILLKHGSNCIVRSAADVDHVIDRLRQLFAHSEIVSQLEFTANVPT